MTLNGFLSEEVSRNPNDDNQTFGEKIKEIARENRIPIRENVPLARALYKSTEVGDMIPEELYKAVASVLASIWKLKPKAGKP